MNVSFYLGELSNQNFVVDLISYGIFFTKTQGTRMSVDGMKLTDYFIHITEFNFKR